METAATILEPDWLTSAAATLEAGSSPMDMWTKLHSQSDTELQLRSCAAASALRTAFLLQLAARLESDDKRRVEALADVVGGGSGALAATDKYVGVLRELCKSAHDRRATLGPQAADAVEGGAGGGETLEGVVTAHVEALERQLRLAEQLASSHRVLAFAAAHAPGALSQQPGRAAADAVPKSTRRAFRDVGLEECLIAYLDEADAAILWDALRLDTVPPDPWAAKGALISLADGACHDIYKIFFYFEASVHESNIIIFPRPPALARLLQYNCTTIGQYTSPLRPPLCMPYTIQ